jgi:hypothetical protein
VIIGAGGRRRSVIDRRLRVVASGREGSVTMRRLAAITLVIGIGLSACSSSDDGSSQAPDASSTSPTTQIVGPSGGTVNGSGVSLNIPAGALASDTPISITPGGPAIPADYTALSSIYTFAPDGTHFLVPVTVTFTLASHGTQPTIFWSNASGGYDEIPSTVNGSTVSASIDHFSHGFAGEHRGKPDAGAADSGNPGVDSGSDASGGSDSGAADSGQGGGDASSSGDAGVDAGASDAGANDAGVADAGGSDAGASEAGASDAGVADAGGSDAGAFDAGASDAGASDAAASEASAPGITASIDNQPMTFATNQKVTLNGTSTTTVQADDTASTTHWTIQITTPSVQQQQGCVAQGGPVVTFTHYTSGSIDSLYSTQASGGACSVMMTSIAKVTGDHAKGVFTATVERLQAPLNSPVQHTISGGSFDLID